ncbi:hypothetical protein ACIGXM_33905 [Kitasatospora sp. NPDC052896]|uniref:hypothetical protein n=1 Tax=Kitasatospora sp. NPDC052896 TaxID=3364061 RepID=UPI0037C680ED
MFAEPTPAETRRPVAADGEELTAGYGPPRASRFRSEPEGHYRGRTPQVVRTAEGAVGRPGIGGPVLPREPCGPGETVPGGVDPRGWRTG